MAKCGFCKKFTGSGSEILAHQNKECGADPRWGRVMELHQKSLHDSAARLARKILGLSKPMPEEKKAQLKAWRETNKEEIKAAAKRKRRNLSNLKERVKEMSEKLTRRRRR